MNRSLLTSSIFMISVWFAASARTEAQGIYWAESDRWQIRTAELDGFNPRNLIENRVPGAMQIDVSERQLYWFDSDTIVRSSLEGTDIVELATVPGGGGLGFDLTGQKMYWLNASTGIYSANLDGSGLELLLPLPGNNNPRSLAVDPWRGKIYWREQVVQEGEPNLNRIQRADLNGSGVETFQSGVGNFAEIAINPSDGGVFWTDRNAGTILRADFDGSNVSNVQAGLNQPLEIGIDSTHQKLYWFDYYPPSSSSCCQHSLPCCLRRIRRSNLDGSNVEPVRSNITKGIGSLVIDPIEGHLYATAENVAGAGAAGTVIERTNLDGSSLVTLVRTKFGAPSSVVIDQDSSRLVFAAQGNFSNFMYETDTSGASQLSIAPVMGDHGGLAISPSSGAVYASDYRGCDSGGNPSRIFKCDANICLVVIGANLGCPRGLGVDDAGGQLYWVDFWSKLAQRSNLDGSGMQTVFTTGQYPWVIAIDSTAGKFYWADVDSIFGMPGSSTIRRANLDGTNQQLLASAAPQVNGITVDTKNEKVYWTTPSSIMRCDVDGSNLETIASGLSGAHGIAVVSCAPSECGGFKNRFLSYEPGRDSLRAGEPVAIRVKLVDLPQFPALNGQAYWVAPHTTAQDGFANETLQTARLQCTPNVQDWTSGVVHLYGPEIVPDSTYEIRYATAACVALGEESCISAPKIVRTGRWGDITEPFHSPEIPAQQPDFSDIAASVAKFRELPGSLSRTRAKVAGQIPNPMAQVDFADISAIVDAFRGKSYPYAGPAACP